MEGSRHGSECKEGCCGLCCTKVENFGVTIGNSEILKNVNLHIHCGELTAIIGPNGAGKSTLLKAMLGEIKHTGTLKFMDAKGTKRGYPLIGYVPQYLDFDKGSPASVLDLFLSCGSKLPIWLCKSKKNRAAVMEGLKRVKADHLVDKRLGALSGGELQRVLLALALDPLPDILLMDEPVSGIDQNGLELFYNTVSELREKYDLSIILVSHDLELVAKHADRVVLISGTVLCNGRPEVVFKEKLMQDTFNMNFQRSLKDGPAGEKEGESS